MKSSDKQCDSPRSVGCCLEDRTEATNLVGPVLNKWEYERYYKCCFNLWGWISSTNPTKLRSSVGRVFPLFCVASLKIRMPSPIDLLDSGVPRHQPLQSGKDPLAVLGRHT